MLALLSFRSTISFSPFLTGNDLRSLKKSFTGRLKWKICYLPEINVQRRFTSSRAINSSPPASLCVAPRMEKQ